MRNRIRIIAFATGALMFGFASPSMAQSDALYQRLGGYDVIAGVVDDFFGRFASDPALTPFLGGLNAAAQGRVRQNFIDFFCARAGGPCMYNGRDMIAAHQGLAIQEAHFDAVMRHLGEALAARGVPAGARQELASIAAGLRSEIVTSGGG